MKNEHDGGRAACKQGYMYRHIIIESVPCICRDSADALIQTNLSKSQKQLTYKPL